MPHFWPYTPADLDGGWIVRLGFSDQIGEVLVYAEGLATPPPTAVLRWKCDEAALPLLEDSGYNHQLTTTNAAGVVCHRPSLRSDSAGFSVGTDTSLAAHDHRQLWDPVQSAPTAGFGFAALMDRVLSGSLTPYVQSGADKVGFFYVYEPTTGSPARELYMFNGSGYALIATGLPAAVFWAFRISATGDFKWWADSTTGTGTFGAFAPGTWATFYQQNDGDYAVDDIHVWPTEPTDVDILAVRFDLVGF